MRTRRRCNIARFSISAGTVHSITDSQSMVSHAYYSTANSLLQFGPENRISFSVLIRLLMEVHVAVRLLRRRRRARFDHKKKYCDVFWTIETLVRSGIHSNEFPEYDTYSHLSIRQHQYHVRKKTTQKSLRNFHGQVPNLP